MAGRVCGRMRHPPTRFRLVLGLGLLVLQTVAPWDVAQPEETTMSVKAVGEPPLMRGNIRRLEPILDAGSFALRGGISGRL